MSHHRRARPVVQVGGFVRKEIAALIRQPRLLIVLVAGPFVILLLFGVGYDQQQTVLRTAFVGPAGSIYEKSLDQFADSIDRYVVNEGYSEDLVAAQKRLEDGDIDAIVVFPADPMKAVMSGEQATITVLHDKIDPIQQVAVEVSAQVAVQELNAHVLEEIVARAQDSLVPFSDSITAGGDALDELDTAVAEGDDDAARRAIDEIEQSADAIQTIASTSSKVARALGGDEASTTALDDLEGSATDFDQTVARLRDDARPITSNDAAELRTALERVEQIGQTATTIDPGVVIQPFTSETANLERAPVTIDDFFAPAAVALLLQHMVLTFAAMSLVADRSLGLFEIFRVGPVGAGRVLLGKYLAFVLVGAVVGAALIASIVYFLDVPLRGDVGWLAGGMAGLLLASIGLGMVVSLVAKSAVQAVQFAMLALLASLFFGGFLLDLDAFDYPVKLLSWVLPVSYGTRLMRDVMLRGIDPSVYDLVGLGTTTVAFCVLAWFLLRRSLRIR